MATARRSTGSPPRMRGKEFHFRHRLIRTGITPAYAGKRHTSEHDSRRSQDHPRVCGEKKGGNAGNDNRRGITPAYAGKRTTGATKSTLPWDHPRVCGEKNHSGAHNGLTMGSPPRMRGKENAHTGVSGRHGITPAYAGKSFPEPRARGKLEDHPRVCGEKTKKIP